MVKFAIVLMLIVCWFFGTMTKVNEKSDSLGAFVVKSIFFWIAIALAYSLGTMH